MAKETADDDSSSAKKIPPEVLASLKSFNEALTCLEDTVYSQKDTFEQILEKDPLDVVRHDVMTLFAANSLFWALLSTRGVSGKANEPLQQELKRTKDFVGRVKLEEERRNAPRLNKHVAKAFVRNAIWEPTSRNEQEEDNELMQQRVENSSEEKSKASKAKRKRKATCD